MAEQDVFSETKTEEQVNPLETLVGEGKKFKTVEDLAKGKLEADSYIAQLEGENKLVREKLAEQEKTGEQTATVAELVKAVREHQGEQGSPDVVSDEDLSNRIKQIMQGETEAQTRARNREQANQAVLDKVQGDVDAAKLYVAEKAKQLGLTPDALADLGERSPQAFAKLVEANPSTSVPPVAALPGANTNSMGNASLKVDGIPTKAHFDKIKKDIGVQKFVNNSRLQKEYLDAAMKLGDRFYN